MFAYSDPTGTGLLQQVGALEVYREAVDRLHHLFHSERDSAFTLREAFDELSPGTQAETGTVEWKAFPVTAGEPPATIDDDRFRLQDERRRKSAYRIRFSDSFWRSGPMKSGWPRSRR